jgi:hypothetical protein
MTQNPGIVLFSILALLGAGGVACAADGEKPAEPPPAPAAAPLEDAVRQEVIANGLSDVAEIAAKGIAPLRIQAEATDAAARIARGVVRAAKTIPDADLAAAAYDVGSGLSRGAAPELRDAVIAAAAEALKAEGLPQDTVRYLYEGALAAEDLPTIEVSTPPEGSSGENGAKGN